MHQIDGSLHGFEQRELRHAGCDMCGGSKEKSDGDEGEAVEAACVRGGLYSVGSPVGKRE